MKIWFALRNNVVQAQQLGHSCNAPTRADRASLGSWSGCRIATATVMRTVIALSLLGASLVGCAQGAPPGFSHGSQWSFPLVDPLADGKLVTSVYLDGRGPYLFAIDPDAPISTVDREALPPAFPYRYRTRMLDESDTSRPVSDATVREIKLGELTISQRQFIVSLDHTFDADGRRIYGILGRDVIEDSLVFGFDRDRGIGWLSTQEAFKPDPSAQVIGYFKGTRYSGITPVRRLVKAEINGKRYDVHLDLGDTPNQLRAEHWPEAQLAPRPLRETLIDEIGTHREVKAGGVAAQVTAAGITRDHQLFVPYDDKRWEYGQLEGTLGLDFFQPYAVAADWHNEKYYLSPRAPSAQSTALRLQRWGNAVPAACASSGCVTVNISAAIATPPENGVMGMAPERSEAPGATTATIARDPIARGVPLEVILSATSPSGQPLPPLTINLPAGAESFTSTIAPVYAGAQLAVLDLSPFPRGQTGSVVVAH